MGKGFLKGSGKSGELRAGSDAQDGLAEAEDAISCFFEGLRIGVIRIASDDDLNGVIGKECGG